MLRRLRLEMLLRLCVVRLRCGGEDKDRQGFGRYEYVNWQIVDVR